MQQTSAHHLQPPLVLASSSPYRQQLLARIVPEFAVASPDVDESALPQESPQDMALRLARLKALSLAAERTGSILIGSDQVPALGTRILRKPGTVERAHAQLEECSGRTVTFFTGVCVVHDGQEQLHVDRTTVVFRLLENDEIRAYVDREQPLDCAGSFKAEGLGITLFREIRSLDPTALQGLPLIWLSAALRKLGIVLY